MRIAVLGTGAMATTTAEGLAAAGHSVVYGSRSPGGHSDLGLPVFSHEDAIRAGELVVNALDGATCLDVLAGLREALDGKVLLDVANAVDEHFDLLHPDDSLGERLQRALPGTRVVKSLNTVWGAVAVDPGRLPAPTTVFLSGDDPEAKQVVRDVLTSLGWAAADQLDLGDITTATAAEHHFVLFTRLRLLFDDPAFNIAVVRAKSAD